MFNVYYNTDRETNLVSRFSTEQEVLALIRPELTVLAVRWMSQQGPVEDYDVVFDTGKLVLKRRPMVGTELELDRLRGLEQAVRDFHYTPDATADELLAWIESTTFFELERPEGV